MGVRHGIWAAGLLLLAGSCGDDDDGGGGQGQTARAAEALARAMHFSGGQLREGAMGLATEDRVEVILPEDQVVRPGRVGIMSLEVDNPIEDDKPERAALMQFGEVDQHVRVPTSRSVEGAGDLNFQFELDDDACKDLCAERIEVPVRVALELDGGDISKHLKTSIAIDCRQDGDPDACEGGSSGGRRDGGTGNAGSSGGRDGSVPISPGTTAAVQDLLDAVEEFENEACSCLLGPEGECNENATARSCYEAVLVAFGAGEDELLECMQMHFEAQYACLTSATCDLEGVQSCIGTDGDQWPAIEEHCGDVPQTIQTGIDACDGDVGLSCEDGEPLTPAQVCDDVEDCADGSDELDCDAPPTNPIDPFDRPDGFPCTDGKMLELDLVCDDAMDCANGLDEMICAMCPDGSGKFSGFDACDGEDDCSDGSDEVGCMYPCASGEMVMIQLYCDGKQDCGDGSDESLCMSGVFTCSDGMTLPFSQVCDGTEDCSNGADEGQTFCN